jgi:hypothetical protein
MIVATVGNFEITSDSRLSGVVVSVLATGPQRSRAMDF